MATCIQAKCAQVRNKCLNLDDNKQEFVQFKTICRPNINLNNNSSVKKVLLNPDIGQAQSEYTYYLLGLLNSPFVVNLAQYISNSSDNNYYTNPHQNAGISIDELQVDNRFPSTLCENSLDLELGEESVLNGLKQSDIPIIRKQNTHPIPYLLVLILLINSNGAQICLGFDGDVSISNIDVLESSHPLNNQQNGNVALTNIGTSQLPNMNPNNDGGDPMRAVTDSFNQPSESLNVAQGWTSILNPFGLGIQPKPRPQSQRPLDTSDSLDSHIRQILVPRVSGTPGNVKVREYIVNSLKKNNYHVELDEFTSNTPIGNVKFANIIASSNPSACRQLVLACHYDSKLMDGFLGATDSAVPCAMLLKVAEGKSFQPTSEDSDDDLGLKLIFFDGEEAFVEWTATDSLYGSRHLAAKWAKQQASGECGSSKKNELEKIELFVLLDLIGASDSSFVMYNPRLRTHYEAMQKHEKSYLTKNGLPQSRRDLAFKSHSVPLDFMQDDHVPFKQRGVPILLLLSHPFPRVWHTINDNYDAIDLPRTRRIMHVIEEFVANYAK